MAFQSGAPPGPETPSRPGANRAASNRSENQRTAFRYRPPRSNASPSRKPLLPVTDSGSVLWEHFCTLKERADISHSCEDRADALAAWNCWLAAFLPDEDSRRAIPRPRFELGVP
jgi:hypothetical protein